MIFVNQKSVNPPSKRVNHSINVVIVLMMSIIPNRAIKYPAILECNAPYFASLRIDNIVIPIRKNGIAIPVIYIRISGMPILLFAEVRSLNASIKSMRRPLIQSMCSPTALA